MALFDPGMNPQPHAQHADDEYGVNVDEQGRHSGGPFDLEVSPLMRIEDLRKLIRVGWLAGLSHDGLESGARLSLVGPLWRPWLVPAHTQLLPRLAGQVRHHPRPAKAFLRRQEPGRSSAHPRPVRSARGRLQRCLPGSLLWKLTVIRLYPQPLQLRRRLLAQQVPALASQDPAMYGGGPGAILCAAWGPGDWRWGTLT